MRVRVRARARVRVGIRVRVRVRVSPFGVATVPWLLLPLTLTLTLSLSLSLSLTLSLSRTLSRTLALTLTVPLTLAKVSWLLLLSAIIIVEDAYQLWNYIVAYKMYRIGLGVTEGVTVRVRCSVASRCA